MPRATRLAIVVAADSGYDVEADADNGDVDVDVRIAADSPRSVTAASDNGDVTIASA